MFIDSIIFIIIYCVYCSSFQHSKLIRNSYSLKNSYQKTYSKNTNIPNAIEDIDTKYIENKIKEVLLQLEYKKSNNIKYQNEFDNELLNFMEMNQSKQNEEEHEVNEDNDEEDNEILNSVIRIFCTHSEPNFSMPWQRLKQGSSTSTGFIISLNQKKYILTNAHSVEYGSIIQVKKRQSENKYIAKVIAIGHECDLCLLDVIDELFWNDVKELHFGNHLPELQEDVSVIGYPVGGESISISSGVVSRIEMQEYAQSSTETSLLAIQIDAAINPGNSGGPCFNSNGEVIGVAFQSLNDEDVENIGYIIPVSVINHFIESFQRHGKYLGVCSLGIRLQGMENNNLRKFYHMKDNETGVLISEVLPLSPSKGILQPGDVLLSLDNIRIANDGTIPFREGKYLERVFYTNYVSQLFTNDIVNIKVLRNREYLDVQSVVWVNEPLVPSILLQKDHIHEKDNIVGIHPSYIAIGGLIFTILTKEYAHTEFHIRDMESIEYWTEEFQLLSMVNRPKTGLL